jgi:hypothetical protein
LRDGEETFKNPINGNWKLSKINCYLPDYRGEIVEFYNSDSLDKIEIYNTERTFKYAAISTRLIPNCNTTASGSYGIDFDTALKGTSSLDSLIVSPTCTINLPINGGPQSFDIPFGVLGLSTEVKDRNWFVADSQLNFEVSSGFRGSSSACGSSCECFYVLDKI